jgi:hypothetical protein
MSSNVERLDSWAFNRNGIDPVTSKLAADLGASVSKFQYEDEK